MDELWVCGRISKGVENEIHLAMQHGIPVKYLPAIHLTDKKYDFTRSCPSEVWDQMETEEAWRLVGLTSLANNDFARGKNGKRHYSYRRCAAEQDYIDEMIEKYEN